MKLINLTPHTIHLLDRSIPPSGEQARCMEVTLPAGSFDGIELIRREYGEVKGLPRATEDTLYIVSIIVRLALPQRCDLASPGDLIRDDDGVIIGARNLIVNYAPNRDT